jgi:hypothetical protein
MSRRVSVKSIFSIGLGFMMACGGSVVGGESGGDDSSGASSPGTYDNDEAGAYEQFDDGGSSGNSGGGFEASVPSAPSTHDTCPIAVPTSGSACNTNGSECEYGGDLFYNCDTVASCIDNAWTVQYPSTSSICSGTYKNPPDCPASSDAVPVQNQCSTPQTCLYPSGSNPELCVCEQDQIDNLPTWGCFVPQESCPPFPNRPRIGTSCATEGLDCNYGSCGNATDVTCFQGVWLITETACD